MKNPLRYTGSEQSKTKIHKADIIIYILAVVAFVLMIVVLTNSREQNITTISESNDGTGSLPVHGALDTTQIPVKPFINMDAQPVLKSIDLDPQESLNSETEQEMVNTMEGSSSHQQSSGSEKNTNLSDLELLKSIIQKSEEQSRTVNTENNSRVEVDRVSDSPLSSSRSESVVNNILQEKDLQKESEIIAEQTLTKNLPVAQSNRTSNTDSDPNPVIQQTVNELFDPHLLLTSNELRSQTQTRTSNSIAEATASQVNTASTVRPAIANSNTDTQEEKPASTTSAVPPRNQTTNTTAVTSNNNTVEQVAAISSVSSSGTSSSSEKQYKKYTIKSGDCLWLIAQNMNVNTKDIIHANKFKNPNLIYPGTVINIPVN